MSFPWLNKLLPSPMTFSPVPIIANNWNISHDCWLVCFYATNFAQWWLTKYIKTEHGLSHKFQRSLKYNLHLIEQERCLSRCCFWTNGVKVQLLWFSSIYMWNHSRSSFDTIVLLFCFASLLNDTEINNHPLIYNGFSFIFLLSIHTNPS